MHLKKNRTKGVAVNGVPIKKASELFGIVNVIFFSPEDLNIIKNGPAERRRFLDLELCQLNKVYVYDLVQYNRVVVQRNKLLKEMDSDPSLKETLNIWDSQLVRFGSELIRLRTRFVEELNELIREIHFHLSGEREELEIRYGIPSRRTVILIWDSSSPNRTISLSLLPLWDLVVLHT